MLQDIAIEDTYTNETKKELIDFMKSVSSVSSFEKPIWFFDKLKRSEGHSDCDYKVYFASIPHQYLEMVRYWVLLRIRNNYSVKSVSQNISVFAPIAKFLLFQCDEMSLFEVNRLTIEAFEEHLESDRSVLKSTKEAIWTALSGFFREMRTWPEMPESNVVPPGNPFSRRELDRKHAERLIPDDILAALDNAFRDERLALEDRLIYWTLRSIPSRVQEVTSIPIECLRPYRDGFIFTLHDWKQSGNQLEPKKRLIHIIDEGHGKFLLDMIRKQQEFAKSVQDKLPENKCDLLFTTTIRNLDSLLRSFNDPLRRRKGVYFILNGSSVRNRFKKLATKLNIRDASGNIFNIITHAFRHNGITERLYEGFSYVEIRDMTGHSGNQMMVTAYSHTKDQKIKDLASEMRESGVLGPPVFFKGRIMNLNPEREAEILKNPRAYRIGKVGICSDITSCSSDLFECLDCEYLVPDADNEEFYDEEYRLWSGRAVKHLKNGNKMLAEQAQHMAELHHKQLDRIRLALLLVSQSIVLEDRI